MRSSGRRWLTAAPPFVMLGSLCAPLISSGVEAALRELGGVDPVYCGDFQAKAKYSIYTQ